MNSNYDIYIYIYHLKIFMSVHLFHESRIANSWKTNMEGEVPFHWRRRNREKAKEGGELCDERLFWVFRGGFIRLFCAVG